LACLPIEHLQRSTTGQPRRDRKIAGCTQEMEAACQILNLVLGPLNLNVLGLVVTIPNPIVLNIRAVPGAGNLLCAVTNLLNGAGPVQQIADLLNQISESSTVSSDNRTRQGRGRQG
jgi:hypothetical protein